MPLPRARKGNTSSKNLESDYDARLEAERVRQVRHIRQYVLWRDTPAATSGTWHVCCCSGTALPSFYLRVDEEQPHEARDIARRKTMCTTKSSKRKHTK